MDYVVNISFEKNGIKEEHKYTFGLTKEEKDFVREIGEMYNYDFNSVLHYLVSKNLLRKLKTNLNENTKQKIEEKFRDDMFTID